MARRRSILEKPAQTSGLCRRRVQGSGGVSGLNPGFLFGDGTIGVGVDIGIDKTNTQRPTSNNQHLSVDDYGDRGSASPSSSSSSSSSSSNREIEDEDEETPQGPGLSAAPEYRWLYLAGGNNACMSLSSWVISSRQPVNFRVFEAFFSGRVFIHAVSSDSAAARRACFSR